MLIEWKSIQFRCMFVQDINSLIASNLLWFISSYDGDVVVACCKWLFKFWEACTAMSIACLVNLAIPSCTFAEFSLIVLAVFSDSFTMVWTPSWNLAPNWLSCSVVSGLTFNLSAASDSLVFKFVQRVSNSGLLALT